MKARTRQVPVGTAELSGTASERPPAPWSGSTRAAELDAVGPLDHQRQRPAGHRVALPVAQQRGQINGLVRAVDAALGIDEGVGASRHDAAGDAAVGQVEGSVFRLRKA